MKIGPLHLQDLDRNYLCIVQIKHDLGGALRQVTLRPEKIHDGLIRLGETVLDEANGWMYPESIEVISIIGIAVYKEVKGAVGGEMHPENWTWRPHLEVVSEDEAYAMTT